MLLNKVWVDCHTKRRTAESTLDFLKLSASDRCFQQPPCKPIFMCQGLNTLHWGWSSPPINRNPYKGYIKPLQLGWWVYQFIPWKTMGGDQPTHATTPFIKLLRPNSRRHECQHFHLHQMAPRLRKRVDGGTPRGNDTFVGWFRNPVNSPVEVTRLVVSPIIYISQVQDFVHQQCSPKN